VNMTPGPEVNFANYSMLSAADNIRKSPCTETCSLCGHKLCDACGDRGQVIQSHNLNIFDCWVRETNLRKVLRSSDSV
jgi:hypothetical protein